MNYLLYHFIARLSLLVLSLLLVTCRKEAYDPLPPATQVGNGTLACRIDGEVWQPRSSDFKSGSTSARYLEKEKTLFIGGFNDRLHEGIVLAISNYTGQTGIYQLDSLCDDLPRVCANVGGYATDKYASFKESYWTNSRFRGRIEITKHTSSGIVSGVFDFEAQHRVSGKVTKITDGRFDMIYRTY